LRLAGLLGNIGVVSAQQVMEFSGSDQATNKCRIQGPPKRGKIQGAKGSSEKMN